MKTLFTLLFLVGMTVTAFEQDLILLDCPSNLVFSQAETITNNNVPVRGAWENDSVMENNADNYTAAGPFNSLRFWGSYAMGPRCIGNGCTHGPTETFRIDIYDADPSTGVIPFFSEELTGHLKQIAAPESYILYNSSGYSIVPYSMHYPFYQVDIDLGTEISSLTGWISIRSLRFPGSQCIFGLSFGMPGDGYLFGHFVKQSGGGSTGTWNTFSTPTGGITGHLAFCLSNNTVNFSGTPVSLFSQVFDNWDGVSDAWADGPASSASADNYSTTGPFSHLTFWGGWVLGSYGDPSCTVGSSENFRVDFYASDPSLGAAPVLTRMLSGTVTATGYRFHSRGDQPIYRVDIDFSPAITMTAGWIRITNMNTAGRLCNFGWLYNHDPVNGTFLDGSLTVQDGGLYFCLGTPCPPGFANVGPDTTVYIGYPPMDNVMLSATGGIWYEWTPTAGMEDCQYNNYAATPIVRPTEATSYTVLVTDANGCTGTADVMVNVMDVRCGTNMDKVLVCHVPAGNGGSPSTQCVSPSKVAKMLEQGSYLGPCQNAKSAIMEDDGGTGFHAAVFPNPFTGHCTIQVDLTDGSVLILEVTDIWGRVISRIFDGCLEKGTYDFDWGSPVTGNGIYILKACTNSEVRIIEMLAQ